MPLVAYGPKPFSNPKGGSKDLSFSQAQSHSGQGLQKKLKLFLQTTLRRWKQVQYLSDIFWKWWTHEYLPLMQGHQKWNSAKRSFTPGDLVLIVDGTAPHNSWLMGRIIEIMPDFKGLVRRVRVKTKTSELERPISKLCLLQEAAAS
ncbi:hypothetical protein SKAU_G00019780 [Synaphobranchus kaupii]|uniref:DUF5641 domain-containing protein n=1 Tax=Synaphobranchus kaupii TaxID=118154 RepID=A0A9Q1GBM6_SYNKA|nr:hypothetical protein SKAU_G00019780 [Synaphobranchus kaupii]